MNQIGDLLGTLDSELLTKQQANQFRRAYMNLLDFSAMAFDDALRMCLTNGGFRLPGEAQKIDRILEEFCNAYCHANPGVFLGGPDAAFLLAYAIIMLNTNLHDPRLRAGHAGHKAMTRDEFVKQFSGVREVADLPPELFISCYNSVSEVAIEWKSEPSNSSAGSDSFKSHKKLDLIIRRAHSRLMTQAHCTHLISRYVCV